MQNTTKFGRLEGECTQDLTIVESPQETINVVHDHMDIIVRGKLSIEYTFGEHQLHNSNIQMHKLSIRKEKYC